MKKLLILRSIVKSILIFCIFMLFSCGENTNINDIEQLAEKFIIPSNTLENFTIIYTDSGRISSKINSPLLINNTSKEEPDDENREFPKGVNVIFYDKNEDIESIMRSDYSIYYYNKGFLEGIGNVIIVNKKGDSVLTEKMYWQQKNKIIYSDVYSTIIQNGQIITGRSGFKADENFTWYEIFDTKGDITIKENDTIK